MYGVTDTIHTNKCSFFFFSISLDAWIGRNFKGVLFYLRAQDSLGKIVFCSRAEKHLHVTLHGLIWK